MQIPASIHSADVQANLSRAIIAISSAVNQSPASKADPLQSLPAFSIVPGVRGWFGSAFVRSSENPLYSDFAVELPFSNRIYANTLDLRKAILPLVTPIVPVVAPAVSPVAYTGTAATLEHYCYDMATAFAATASTNRLVRVAPMFDPIAIRGYLKIFGKFDSGFTDLLSAGGSVASP
jgi:hypothetical protein